MPRPLMLLSMKISVISFKILEQLYDATFTQVIGELTPEILGNDTDWTAIAIHPQCILGLWQRFLSGVHHQQGHRMRNYIQNRHWRVCFFMLV